MGVPGQYYSNKPRALYFDDESETMHLFRTVVGKRGCCIIVFISPETQQREDVLDGILPRNRSPSDGAIPGSIASFHARLRSGVAEALRRSLARFEGRASVGKLGRGKPFSNQEACHGTNLPLDSRHLSD